MSDDREPWLDRFRSDYDAPVPVDPDLRRRIADRLAAAPRPRVRLFRLRLFGDWLFEPLPLTLTPARLLLGAAAAAVAVAISVTAPRDRPGDAAAPEGAASTAPPSAMSGDGTVDRSELVRFVFRSAGGGAVAVVGDFNGWDPQATPMQKLDADGVWSASVLLPTGRHVYAFIIDGTTWVPDPAAPLAPEDGFGTRNSVLLVGGSDL